MKSSYYNDPQSFLKSKLDENKKEETEIPTSYPTNQPEVEFSENESVYRPGFGITAPPALDKTPAPEAGGPKPDYVSMPDRPKPDISYDSSPAKPSPTPKPDVSSPPTYQRPGIDNADQYDAAFEYMREADDIKASPIADRISIPQPAYGGRPARDILPVNFDFDDTPLTDDVRSGNSLKNYEGRDFVAKFGGDNNFRNSDYFDVAQQGINKAFENQVIDYREMAKGMAGEIQNSYDKSQIAYADLFGDAFFDGNYQPAKWKNPKPPEGNEPFDPEELYENIMDRLT